jgi:hypothetical protein
MLALSRGMEFPWFGGRLTSSNDRMSSFMLHAGDVPRPEVTVLRIVPQFQNLEDGQSV